MQCLANISCSYIRTVLLIIKTATDSVLLSCLSFNTSFEFQYVRFSIGSQKWFNIFTEFYPVLPSEFCSFAVSKRSIWSRYEKKQAITVYINLSARTLLKHFSFPTSFCATFRQYRCDLLASEALHCSKNEIFWVSLFICPLIFWVYASYTLAQPHSQRGVVSTCCASPEITLWIVWFYVVAVLLLLPYCAAFLSSSNTFWSVGTILAIRKNNFRTHGSFVEERKGKIMWCALLQYKIDFFYERFSIDL